MSSLDWGFCNCGTGDPTWGFAGEAVSTQKQRFQTNLIASHEISNRWATLFRRVHVLDEPECSQKLAFQSPELTIEGRWAYHRRYAEPFQRHCQPDPVKRGLRVRPTCYELCHHAKIRSPCSELGHHGHSTFSQSVPIQSRLVTLQKDKADNWGVEYHNCLYVCWLDA